MNIYEELKLLKEEVQKASSREALDCVFKKWREKYLLPLREQIKNFSSPEEKKKVGLLFKELQEKSQEIYQTKKDELSTWKNIYGEPRPSFLIEEEKIAYTSVNFLADFVNKLSNFLEKYNFNYYEDSEIVKVHENFDSLLIPENHPARATSDSFFLKNISKNSEGEKMLRTHNTTSTLEILKKFKGKEFKGASIGSVYRKEDNDPTHLSQFTQLDLVWVGRDLNLENLRELVEALLNDLFKDSSWSKEYVLRPSYFPFTSPSFEVDLRCNCGLLRECRLCKGSGWIEILGCGFLENEIMKKTHPNHCSLALGLGVERICMLQNSIQDIRSFYENDFTKIVKSANKF
ncbi:tRNA ligase subunit PheS family protein [Mycoplasma parvum]|uniref:phenylalanine--tRNA ligase n=1 Tax=Mycoplasma parvum str. Indiana TaxID=1403316 RepID=U5NCY0_9MOLU|nr:hypothetical protein [Mycoplasma parvum]AGX89282.1 hypothetical protein PRV_02780 [Mycoplasma parvum str. Indiana]